MAIDGFGIDRAVLGCQGSLELYGGRNITLKMAVHRYGDVRLCAGFQLVASGDRIEGGRMSIQHIRAPASRRWLGEDILSAQRMSVYSVRARRAILIVCLLQRADQRATKGKPSIRDCEPAHLATWTQAFRSSAQMCQSNLLGYFFTMPPLRSESPLHNQTQHRHCLHNCTYGESQPNANLVDHRHNKARSTSSE